MKVIVIREAKYGDVIGVAKDVFSAISWLIDSKWIKDNEDVWSEEAQEWVELKTLYSRNDLVKMTIDEFDANFDASVYLEESFLVDYNMTE